MRIVGVRGAAPAMRKIAHKYDWEYAEPWEFSILTDEGLLRLEVSPHYRTDLASVPQALKNLFDNGSGDYGVMIACQVHDFFYATKYASRRLADDLFYLLLRHYGMGWLKAKFYYNAVHLFGEKAYEEESDELLTDRLLCRFYWSDK